MNGEMYRQIAGELAGFRLPRYQEITDVGLYLEQTVRLINTALSPLGEPEITASMVSNYVKKKLIASPQKKLYFSGHIAELLMIAVVKNAVSLEDVRLLLERQREQGAAAETYDAFCAAFERLLRQTLGLREEGAAPERTGGVQELRETMLTAVVQRIYLDRYLAAYRRSGTGEEPAPAGGPGAEREA